MRKTRLSIVLVAEQSKILLLLLFRKTITHTEVTLHIQGKILFLFSLRNSMAERKRRAHSEAKPSELRP